MHYHRANNSLKRENRSRHKQHHHLPVWVPLSQGLERSRYRQPLPLQTSVPIERLKTVANMLYNYYLKEECTYKITNLNKAIMEMEPQQARSDSRIVIKVTFDSRSYYILYCRARQCIKTSTQLGFNWNTQHEHHQ